MSVEKFDKIYYEFTLASGDIDWSDCNLYGEKNGKKTWLGTLTSEKSINGSDEYWTYEDIEDFARKAVISDEMYRMLEQLHGVLKSVPILQGDIEKVLKKARGEQ